MTDIFTGRLEGSVKKRLDVLCHMFRGINLPGMYYNQDRGDHGSFSFLLSIIDPNQISVLSNPDSSHMLAVRAIVRYNPPRCLSLTEMASPVVHHRFLPMEMTLPERVFRSSRRC